MYKLEMHLHTKGKSFCAEADVQTIAREYAIKGYNGIVCTNHYASYIAIAMGFTSAREYAEFIVEGYTSLKEACKDYGIDVFFGLELQTDDYAYVNEEPPYCEMLIYGISPEWLVGNPKLLLGMELDELKDFAEEQGWVVAQSHPFRPGIDCQLSSVMHGVEVYNGNNGDAINNQLALEFAQKHDLLQTAGSDYHRARMANCGVMLQNAVKTNEQLVAELRKCQHAVFVDE